MNCFKKKVGNNVPILFTTAFIFTAAAWFVIGVRLLADRNFEYQDSNLGYEHLFEQKTDVINPLEEAQLGLETFNPTKCISPIFESKIRYSASGTETAVIIEKIELSPTKVGSNYIDGAKLLIARGSFKVPSLGQKDVKVYKEENAGLDYPPLDLRFIRNVRESPSSGKEELRHLFSIWASWCDENEIPYWIAHTSLLGYKWGKQILPWENQIEVHIPANLLYDLEKYNEKKLDFGERYLFEINPRHQIRHHRDHYMIDARLIDVLNGHSIRISGISSKELASSPVGTEKDVNLDVKLQESEFSGNLFTKSGLTYNYEDIFPLVRTTFEGVSTWRPNLLSEILAMEFGLDALTNGLHKQYNFNKKLGSWRVMETCQELHDAYVQPIINQNGQQVGSPKLVWIKSIWDSSGEQRCAISIVDNIGSRDTFTAVWKTYEELPDLK